MSDDKLDSILAELKIMNSSLNTLVQLNRLILKNNKISLVDTKHENLIAKAETLQETKAETLKIESQKIDLVKENKTKVSVQQVIKYPDSSLVFLAKIKIMDENRKIIKETKTNHQGKWILPLQPGKYFVHLVKEPINGKPKIDDLYEIVVPEDKVAIELDEHKKG